MQTPQKEPGEATPSKRMREPPSLKKAQKVVYITVGNQEEPFGIHLDLACYHSPYFKACFTGDFSEAITGKLVLDKTEPEVFGLFVHWMYTQNIVETILTDSSLKRSERFFQELPSPDDLADLWLLAEYLRVPKLQNQALNVLRRRMERILCVNMQFLSGVYGKSMEGSMLRKLCIDRLVWSPFPSPSSACLIKLQSASPEMLRDLWVAERERRMNNPTQNPLLDMTNYLVKERKPEGTE